MGRSQHGTPRDADACRVVRDELASETAGELRQCRVALALVLQLVVFDDYAFDEPAPWLRLAEDSTATTVTPDEIQRALEPNKAVIEERGRARARWLERKEK